MSTLKTLPKQVEFGRCCLLGQYVIVLDAYLFMDHHLLSSLFHFGGLLWCPFWHWLLLLRHHSIYDTFGGFTHIDPCMYTYLESSHLPCDTRLMEHMIWLSMHPYEERLVVGGLFGAIIMFTCALARFLGRALHSRPYWRLIWHFGSIHTCLYTKF